MADISANRSELLLRFAALLLLGLAADALFFHLLLNAAFGPLPTRTVSLLASLGIMLAMLQPIYLTLGNRLSIGRPGIFAILLIAAVLNYGLYAALLLSLPDLQPLAAMVLATAASMVFSFFGYSRFVFRSE